MGGQYHPCRTWLMALSHRSRLPFNPPCCVPQSAKAPQALSPEYQQPFAEGLLVSILQMQTLRLKGSTGLAQGHISFIIQCESTYYVPGPQKTTVGTTKGEF